MIGYQPVCPSSVPSRYSLQDGAMLGSNAYGLASQQHLVLNDCELRLAHYLSMRAVETLAACCGY